MSATPIELRPAGPGDEARLLALLRAYYDHDGLVLDEDAVRAGLPALVADPALGRAVLAFDGAAPVGYALVTFGFDLEFGGVQGTLTDLFVEDAVRGTGLGKRLLAAAEDACRSRGARTLQLQVLAGNRRGRSFYEARGFAALERVPMVKWL